MTNEEAIVILRQKYKTVSQCLTADECRENNEAIRIAIAALERDRWISNDPTVIPAEEYKECK